MKPPALSIGLFTYSTTPRGSVVHTANLADALHDAGCDVTVYAHDKDGRGFFRPLRAKLCLVPASPTPKTTAELVRVRAAELADFLAAARPRHDIHHAEDCLTASGLLELAARRGDAESAGLVRTVHHVEAFTDPYLQECQRRSITRASVCFSVSHACARDVVRSFNVGPLPITNGVDLARFANVDPQRLATWTQTLETGAGPAVLAVGGVEERKNTLAILRAFVRVRRVHAAAQLWILGGATVLDHGAYRAAFDRELAQLSPRDRGAVAEIGVVEDADVPAIFRLADVLAFPSSHEGFGLAALEALAAELPVVASHRPPLTEFLDDSCAVLVDPDSDGDIARGLLEALRGPRDARCHAGLRRARAYSWSHVATLHIEHYKAWVRARASGAAAPSALEIRHA